MGWFVLFLALLTVQGWAEFSLYLSGSQEGSVFVLFQ